MQVGFDEEVGHFWEDAAAGFSKIELDAYVKDAVEENTDGPIGVVTVAGTIVDGKAPLGTAGGGYGGSADTQRSDSFDSGGATRWPGAWVRSASPVSTADRSDRISTGGGTSLPIAPNDRRRVQ